MGRKCAVWVLIAGLVVLVAPGLALAKALKQQVAVTNPDGTTGTAKVILNYSQGEAGLIANVNGSKLTPDSTYTVNVGVLVDIVDPVTGLVTGQTLEVYGSGTMSTKPPKEKKGIIEAPKNCKAHVNIHIPWKQPTPPVLLELTVQITGVANP